jgi:2,4-dienoyl-CoA reductase (NADPH2)
VLANRARFVREIVQAIRARVGPNFHLQMKISATEFNNALMPDEKPGNTIEDSIQVCRWLKEDGVDAIHVSSGSAFPHPKNPAGGLPIGELRKTYDSLISSGVLTLRNYLLFTGKLTGELFRDRWETARGPLENIEGLNLPDARAIKQAVGDIPVVCTGGFQTAAIIEAAIARGDCDAVSIARPLIANNDLVKQFERGIGRPPNPCTYCNNCLVNAPENPLGCYDETRFPTRDAMVREILSVFHPQTFQ